MPQYTCTECGAAFSLPPAVAERYPGWTPRRCRVCRDGRPGARVRTTAVEENLTVAEVLDRYHEGPHTGVFTDGSADPNPGPGGWGAVYVVDDAVMARSHGREPRTTNNRMELTALLAGYDLVPAGTPMTLYSDSDLAVRTINEWAPQWERRGWRRKGGAIANLDLVRLLYAKARQRPELELRWIPGHSGARWNEYADALSTAYRRSHV